MDDLDTVIGHVFTYQDRGIRVITRQYYLGIVSAYDDCFISFPNVHFIGSMNQRDFIVENLYSIDKGIYYD